MRKLFPNVVLYAGTLVGERVRIHANSTIGADGFGYAPADGVHHKVPQIGSVRIEEDVEIGANSCIDRGALGETRIGKGTKIDNHVQIAHGVRIGTNSILVSQTGISGSASIGDNVTLARQGPVSWAMSMSVTILWSWAIRSSPKTWISRGYTLATRPFPIYNTRGKRPACA